MKKSLSPRNVFERKVSEADIVRQIRALLSLNGIVTHEIVERIPWGKRTSTPGMPDLIAVCHGFKFSDARSYPLVVFIEVKRPGAFRRPKQVAWIEQARRDGLCAFFAESCEDVVAGLAQIGVTVHGLR